MMKSPYYQVYSVELNGTSQKVIIKNKALGSTDRVPYNYNCNSAAEVAERWFTGQGKKIVGYGSAGNGKGYVFMIDER